MHPTGSYLEDAGARYRRHYYANAMNFVRRHRDAYYSALAQRDLLLVPTVPVRARPLPSADVALETVIDLASKTSTILLRSISPIGVDHAVWHGRRLPIGVMLVSKAIR